ncbi:MULTISPECIES: chromate transporter [Burkholderiales]|jgi:chromate transporter|uniref:Chromate efflux transporter n=1 Tax=Caenimonas koreensis DSM 17982 TaxID=1121255 RepID=A0A844BH90_9BURK|nr:MULTISPECIES: chromate transporter [Burkholderiales]MBK9196920.1 chromate transporter [Betaproteobacteria bacterium]MBP7965910.1 chromate transporter [Burkholderiaceae bacterium]MDO9146120.1 chromate transporter [Hydrogenophaga sp.]MDP3165209.1 chromate transporter [Hydrogenophaga sp.]MDP3811724.1 chromate transporter [Hydrogenophaga sp.]
MSAQTTTGAAGPEAVPPTLTYFQLFMRFLKFGFLAWGGPVAQVAMLRRELVNEERWISSERFNRLLAVMQVLPGPEAHELCVHLGMRAKGRLGGVLAGLAFMLPGFLLMLALSWLYFRMDIAGTALGAAFLGVQAAVIALIVRAVHRIGEHILVDRWLWAIAIVAALASAAGVAFWITLPAAGGVYALWMLKRGRLALLVAAGAVALAAAMALWAPRAQPLVEAVVQGEASLLLIFVAGLKAGLLTFGGAYTAIPFIRNDAVGRGWITDGQFLDGLALSGVLPAPLIIFATFVGYVAGGPLGALVMTAGVFLPAFAFSLIFYDRLEAVLEVKEMHAFLDGVAAGVVGLIAATTVDLAFVTAARVPSLAVAVSIFVAALAFLYAWKNKLNIAVAIIGAGVAGWLLMPSGA